MNANSDMNENEKVLLRRAYDRIQADNKFPEAIVLNHVLLMAQQSLYPELYEDFLRVYNHLVDRRGLPLDKIT